MEAGRVTARIAAHLGTLHIETIDFLDHEAERATVAIEDTIRELMSLYDIPQWERHQHIYTILNKLPNRLGKSVYDSLLRCGQRTANNTTRALVKGLPDEYLPYHIVASEAVGGNILKALLNPFKIKDPAITRKTFKQRLYDLIIEPLKASVLEKIVLGGAQAISRLMQTVRRQLNPQKVADIFVKGIASGKNRVELAQDLRNELGATKAQAKRFARTEGIRVATESNLAAFEKLGDMVSGYMIHSVLDEKTRPLHRARNGQIFYKEPVGDQKSVKEMPRPPIEPDGSVAWNCRCWISVVFAEDLGISIPQNAEGKLIPDQIIYNDWFKQATERQKRIAVGSRRYAMVIAKHGENVEYYHFVDEDGSLLPLEDIAKESPADTLARVTLLRSQANSRRIARRDVLVTGST